MANTEMLPTIKLRVVRGFSGELYIIKIYGIGYEDSPDILDESGDDLSDLLDEEALKKFSENETFFEVELIVKGEDYDGSGEYVESWIELLSVTPLKVEFKAKTN